MATLKKQSNTLSVKKLSAYAEEINGLLRSTLQSAVRIGEILKDVRDNLLPYGEWLDWVDNKFEGSITRDTAANFINLFDLYNEYSEEYPKGLESLSLSSLYILSRHTVDSEVQRAVLEIAEEDESSPPSREEVRSIVRTFRQIKLEEAGVAPELQPNLINLEISEDPNEVRALSKLSKRKQEAVVECLTSGDAKSTKEAIKFLRSEKEALNVITTDTVDVAYTELKEVSYASLKDIPSESVNVAFVEAPLKAQFVETELHDFSKELDRILLPGGYAVITVGHKAAMFCGPEVEPLKPVHLLCLRRQPGSTRSIVGTNIMSASVFAIFCYKAPYRAPSEMLVDLHTYSEVTDTEALAGLDEVYTGLEKCIERILTPLVKTNDIVLHAVLSKLHFNVKDCIKQSSLTLQAGALYTYKA